MNDLNNVYSLSISYHQITVYSGDDSPPVIHWTNDAIRLGFATGDNGVSFEGVNNGQASIIVSLDHLEHLSSVDRAVTVTFTNSSDYIHITSVMSQILTYPIPKGDYQLTCYTSLQSDQDIYYFHFQSK
ncbi:competence protein ComJ [Bacillus sp. NPDC093026]|uniref:competence protein ComJ n=1 Tax=Bacillus sp. NPDC093026 TaxID=3363948 RepID=UPI00382FE238